MSTYDDWLWQQGQSDYQPAAQDYTTSGNEYYSPYGGEQYQIQPYEYQPQEAIYQAPGSYPTSNESYYQMPAAQQSGNDLFSWDTLNNIGSKLQSPGGGLLSGLIGAGISAYGANKQNALNKNAQKEYQRQLAARQAKAALYDSPLRLTMQRQQAAGPVEGKGSEAQFFTNNQLPSFYAKGGSATSNEPSILGFIKYMMAGKKLPSEVYAESQSREPQGIQEALEAYGNPQSRLDKQMEEQGLACGGSPGYVSGGSAGQADAIPARLSDGEYVMDADVVSALGDGNNAAGAAALDKAREAIRTHKRSASPKSIPPKAKSPLEYMKGKKHGK